ncbi:MAG: (d)CMP kinase, partial [Methylicorpusculum sp.]|nr:(d)CMP kinase [Methylicorpusculum sp.]
MTVPVLTIDGPSGAGKGTVSRAVARKLDWNYLDSGSIYRALAIAALVAGVDINDEPSVAAVADEMKLAFDCGDELTVFLNGENITSQLPLESTAKSASIVAAWPEVR